MRKLKGVVIGCMLMWCVLCGVITVLWDELLTKIDGKYRGPLQDERHPEEKE